MGVSDRVPEKIHIRMARLEDAAAITSIHCSYRDRWTRTIGAEIDEVPYDMLSIAERWGFGGPWMSVETCAIHLNNMLLRRHYPMLALIGDRAVGEMEVFIGRESAPFEKNAHVGLLYVHKDFRGRGVGTALMKKAEDIAAENFCDTITVASNAPSLGFYEKCGFKRAGTLVEIEAVVRPYDVQMRPIPGQFNDGAFTWGMHMPIGRYQSSAFHLFELSDGYAIPGTLSLTKETAHITIGESRSMLAFAMDEHQSKATIFGWTQGASPGSLATAALTLLHAKGVKYANILLSFEDHEHMGHKLEATLKGSRDVLVRKRRA